MGRGNQYIQLVKVLYCKLLTGGKQLPAFPLEVRPGFKLSSQRWEASVLPLRHHGPSDILLICNNRYATANLTCMCQITYCTCGELID